MRHLNFTKIFTILSFSLTTLSVDAQRVRANVGLGVSAYLGDLVQSAPVLKEVSGTLSIGGTYDITEQLRGRLGISILGAKGDDKFNARQDYRERNLNFKTSIWEVALMAEYDFLNRADYSIVPYIFAGPGVYHFNPKTTDNAGNTVELQPIGTEGQNLAAYADRKYNLTQLNLQFGAGIRYEVSETFSLGAEVSFRKLFTDYLDDVSHGAYLTKELLAANQVTAAQLSYRKAGFYDEGKAAAPRGNPNKKDFFYTFQVTASFRLDGLHLGRDLDFYSTGSYRTRSKTRNPKNVF